MKAALTELDVALLTAALAQDGREVEAFHKFMGQVDFSGEVDGGHYRMLPLIYVNLVRSGEPSAKLARLRGVYRHSWCKSHEIAARGSEAIRALNAVNIPVLVSKGLVLAREYYDSPALRPMSDVDLMVPVERVREASEALMRIGYRGSHDISKFSRGHYRDFVVSRHSDDMKRGPDQVDLHWYLTKHCRSAGANRRFWALAQPFNLPAGLIAQQLHPSHMLMHVVVHGMRWNEMSPLRWVADAAMILRREAAQLNWNALFDEAAALGIEGHFRSGLEYLRTLGLADMPVWPRTPKTTLAERAERWAHGKSFAVNLAVDVIRLMNSDARPRIPHLAGKWVARRIGAL